MYTYDPLARLTGFTRAGTTTNYGWQAVSNRSSVQTGANPAVTTTFDLPSEAPNSRGVI